MKEKELLEQWLDQISHGKGLFVSGTDTGVGKTWAGVKILELLKRKGVQTRAFKPVESGWPTNNIAQTDAFLLASAANPPQKIDHCCGFQFSAATSPARAATLESKTLHLSQLIEFVKSRQDESFCLFEGAGGFYSPLAQDGLNADFAEALNLPILLVAEDKLGCLNSILLSAEAIHHRGLNLAGVVLNEIHRAPDELDNRAELLTWLEVPVIRLD